VGSGAAAATIRKWVQDFVRGVGRVLPLKDDSLGVHFTATAEGLPLDALLRPTGRGTMEHITLEMEVMRALRYCRTTGLVCGTERRYSAY
jgi:hypothetical protein